MGFFSSDVDSKESASNIIKIDNNQALDVSSDEILIVLIIIASLLAILVLLRVIGMYKKHIKRENMKDRMILKSLEKLDS